MHYSTKHIVRISALILCLFCSACAGMQQQIDDNARDLSKIRSQLSRTHNDVEQLRSEIQALNGTLEENNVVKDREIREIKKRLDSIAAMLTTPSLDTYETETLPVAGEPTATVDNAQAHYDRAKELYDARDYEKSRSSFEDFLKQFRGSPLAQNAFFWIGMSHFQQKNYRASIAALGNLTKEFPQGSKVPDAYYWQATGFIELKDMVSAQILLEDLMQTYPSSEATQKAKTKYQELKLNTSR